jgi:hypothetical protein
VVASDAQLIPKLEQDETKTARSFAANRLLGREEIPLAWYAFQLIHAAFLEANS